MSNFTTWLRCVKAHLFLIIAILLIALVLFLLIYSICQDFNDRKLRIDIAARLKDLAQAVHAYHDEHRTFPPHAVYDKDGKPLLSWRVIVLPYLGQQELYQQFKLDEPWDSPHNKKLIDKMPEVYLHPARPAGEDPFTTHWQVFVGPGAAFEGQRGLRLGRDFADGSSNTILIAEAARGVPWTKPEDLPYAPGQPLPALGGYIRGGGFYTAFADGSTREIWPETSEGAIRGAFYGTSEATIRAIITRNANDKPGPDWIP